jgi:hypothetical protein
VLRDGCDMQCDAKLPGRINSIWQMLLRTKKSTAETA